MKHYGGYNSLSLQYFSIPDVKPDISLAYGRCSIKFALNLIEPKLIYLPFYICSEVLDVVKECNIPFRFYDIDLNFEISNLSIDDHNYVLIYPNYFGIKYHYCNSLVNTHKHRLIIDSTHSLQMNYNVGSWSFNSLRKFFGVPDGSELNVPDEFCTKAIKKYESLKTNTNLELRHLFFRKLGFVQQGYKYFIKSESQISSHLKKQSFVSSLLSKFYVRNINFQFRREKFNLYNKYLNSYNLLALQDIISPHSPYAYPFLPNKKVEKKIFWESNIYIPHIWKLTPGYSDFPHAYQLSDGLLSLPLDERMTLADCSYIIDFVLSICEKNEINRN